jgi:hypothetical protein
MSSAPRLTPVRGELDLHVNYGSFDDLSMRQRAAERRRQLVSCISSTFGGSVV